MKAGAQVRGYFGKFTGKPSRLFIHAVGKEGFTLVELMVTIVISLFALAATTSLFAQLFTQFKQESTVSQTGIGSSIGLEYLEKDIQSAGYGLPWNVNGVNYQESAVANALTDDAPSNPPRAIFSINGTGTGLNGSDYLVIKSQMAAVNDSAAGKSTWIKSTGGAKVWGNPNWDLNPSDNAIVVSTIDNIVSLVTNPGALFGVVNDYAPTSATETRMIYGVADAADAPTGLRMPFNRADYYIAPPGTAGVTQPQRCAPDTGVLVKAVMKQTDGTYTLYPILDCVADMQVIFDLGNDQYSNDISNSQNFPASWIRQNVHGVRVYILAQQGQKDPTYTYPSNTITVGEFGLGRNYPIANDQKHYRWRLYTIVEKPMNLGQ